MLPVTAKHFHTLCHDIFEGTVFEIDQNRSWLAETTTVHITASMLQRARSNRDRERDSYKEDIDSIDKTIMHLVTSLKTSYRQRSGHLL